MGHGVRQAVLRVGSTTSERCCALLLYGLFCIYSRYLDLGDSLTAFCFISDVKSKSVCVPL